MDKQKDSVELPGDIAFENKRVLVTGSTRGIGRGIAESFASRGARVAIAARDEEKAAGVANEISERFGTPSLAMRLDVTRSDSVSRAFDSIQQEWGGLDVLVNNAGIANSISIDDLDEASWNRVLETNLNGVYRCSRAALRLMKRGDSIVNIASISGSMVNVPQYQANYNTSKAAVIMFTRSLAVELAPLGIRVNSVSPGYTLTDMNRRPEVQDLIEIWTERTPMNRLASIAEIAGPVMFLASEMAGFVTGHDLVVDGGITLLC
jgi:NAD(P)-dependent dehydrogenase (short-subunit alcohol dehydrogenase family)